MTYIHCQKKYLTNEDDNIIQVRRMSIIMLIIFMNDTFFLYMSYEGILFYFYYNPTF